MGRVSVAACGRRLLFLEGVRAYEREKDLAAF